MQSEVQIKPQLKKACEHWVEQIASQISAVRGVVIATVDGFELASSAMPAEQVARVCAMTSSISALGEVVAQEGGIGSTQMVLIEAKSGYLAVLPVVGIKTALTIGVLANSEAIAGQVLHSGRMCAQALAKIEAELEK